MPKTRQAQTVEVDISQFPIEFQEHLQQFPPELQGQIALAAYQKVKNRHEMRQRDISYRIELRGAALRLQTATADEIILSGPAGTGKSVGCLVHLHRSCVAHPNARWAIIRKTRASLTQTGLVTYETMVLGLDNPMVTNVQRAYRKSYFYPNGSEVIVGGMDNPSRILSGDLDGIYVQEANELSITDWETLITRLRNGAVPIMQIIGDTNPDRPDHWIRQRAERNDLVMYFSEHKDNPSLHDGTDWTAKGKAYLSKLRKLTGVRRERYLYGRWVASEGMVYDEFDEKVHTCDPFPIPEDWVRFRAVDFGYNNPFVCLWGALSPDDVLYIYRQWVKTEMLVEDHTPKIIELSEGEHISKTLADHDLEDRKTMEKHGIITVKAKKDISTGIEAVKARLKVGNSGKPRLMIFRDSLVEVDENLAEVKMPTDIVGEFYSYKWDEPSEGKPNKDRPYPMYDHCLDTLRYMCMEIHKGHLAVARVAVYRMRPPLMTLAFV